ncbi:MAG: type III pantothenate kinase [Microscillaceae bacterium]|nr:type III pantothenate kinase [Microscillaceae bacterium]
MNLAIDIGNSRLKAALFQGNEMIEIYSTLPEGEFAEWLLRQQATYTILSSVRKDVDTIKSEIERISQLIVLESGMEMPFQSLYQTPHTLGVDRLAAIAGAQALFPGQACLVIDLGTCITYDFIDQESYFWGGNIAPGLQIRFRAMHEFTANLPLVQINPEEELPYTGKSTRGAMQSGVVYGIVHEIEGAIRYYHQKVGNFVTILTGGDALYFETKIKEQIFVNQNLTLIGLNGILQYHVGKSV